MEEPDPKDAHAYAMDCVLQWNAQILRLCRYSCRGRLDLVDEMWSECIEWVPRIIARFDATKIPELRIWVLHSLRRRLWKWIHRKTIADSRREIFRDHLIDSRCVDLDGRDEVDFITDGMSEKDRALLVLRYGQEMSQNEVGERLEMPQRTVSNHARRALERARMAACRKCRDRIGRCGHGEAFEPDCEECTLAKFRESEKETA